MNKGQKPGKKPKGISLSRKQPTRSNENVFNPYKDSPRSSKTTWIQCRISEATLALNKKRQSNLKPLNVKHEAHLNYDRSVELGTQPSILAKEAYLIFDKAVEFPSPSISAVSPSIEEVIPETPENVSSVYSFNRHRQRSYTKQSLLRFEANEYHSVDVYDINNIIDEKVKKTRKCIDDVFCVNNMADDKLQYKPVVQSTVKKASNAKKGTRQCNVTKRSPKPRKAKKKRLNVEQLVIQTQQADILPSLTVETNVRRTSFNDSIDLQQYRDFEKNKEAIPNEISPLPEIEQARCNDGSPAYNVQMDDNEVNFLAEEYPALPSYNIQMVSNQVEDIQSSPILARVCMPKNMKRQKVTRSITIPESSSSTTDMEALKNALTELVDNNLFHFTSKVTNMQEEFSLELKKMICAKIDDMNKKNKQGQK